MLASEGLRREGLGREAFVSRVWEWKEQYGARIGTQIRRLGASCDWSRERFTLDEQLSRAARSPVLQRPHARARGCNRKQRTCSCRVLRSRRWRRLL